MKRRVMALATITLLAACGEAPITTPQPGLAPVDVALSNVTYASGTAAVTAWDPIFPAAADPSWGTTICIGTPAVGLNANWQNPHPAFTGFWHPWINDWFTGAGWINAWDERNWQGVPPSKGPGGQSWTKYETTVQGNGAFVIRLLADNCSWIYLDGTLVGVQGTDLSKNSYGLLMNGTHTLTFIIFDGGGAAGGKFILETTTSPPPPLNDDLDGDGHPNDSDDLPLDPTEWLDSDGDGHGDNSDVFPYDPSDWADRDGDGVGDNLDAYPDDPTRWLHDTTPPVITADVAGTQSGGWYTSNVSVTWTVTDPETAITSTSGCEASSVTSDTDGMTFTCTASSSGGEDSESVTIKRDATGPAIAFSGNAGSYTVDQTVSITCSASDALSGMASSTCPGASGDAYALGLGSHTLNASATDIAGNQSSASASYTVTVTSGSLCALVQRWVNKAGVAHSMCQQLKNGAYGAFINHVKAQSGKSVSTAHAAILIGLAGQL